VTKCTKYGKIWRRKCQKLGQKAAAELKYRKPFEAGKKEI